MVIATNAVGALNKLLKQIRQTVAPTTAIDPL